MNFKITFQKWMMMCAGLNLGAMMSPYNFTMFIINTIGLLISLYFGLHEDEAQN
jgi:hypothetical protein